MKSIIGGACIALVGVAFAAIPQAASAAIVGEYNECGAENLSVAVAAAGHTWVPVATLDAPSLQGLNALILRTCNSYSGNAAVNTAVANGMDLVLDGRSIVGSALPGTPAFSFNGPGGCQTNYSIAPGAPVINGPGGTLTDDSLDVGAPGGIGGFCTITGGTPLATLPVGTIPFVTTADGNNVGALGYSHAAGQVAVSDTQLSNAVVYSPSEYVYAGAKTYYINALAWALRTTSTPPVTCTSEGYLGAQLEWCKNICERGYTGATLSMWVRRWTDRFRILPYCAAPSQPTIR